MPKQYFRVDGADIETGNETYLVLQARTKPQAESLARDQGLLISSVRVAAPEDWGATPPPDPLMEPEAATSHSAEDTELPHYPDRFIDQPVEEQPAPAPTQPVSDFDIPEPTAPVPQPKATAASIVLACVGSALVIGGVLALALALWPDNTLRNELQQVDFRIHELSQTILGSMLVMGGLIVFLLAAICYLLPGRSADGR